MTRSAVVFAACLLLAGCGDGPLGAAEGASSVPADAPAGAAPGPDYAGDFDLAGTEPFWVGRVREGGLTLDRMEGGAVTLSNPGVRIDGEQGVWDAEAGAPTGGQGHRLVFRLTPQPCSDGMSDRVFTHAAEVWLDGTTFKGCAARPEDLARQARP
ncbi:hypothetical protein CFHF_16715 [Caulobacter flavus]|uniref:Uncharacterized protein n=1 Tax=Caulobacter flavus TaxID=1679497 RepID=A0A2N5CQW6_9CAUL|nr:hypothetical protein [Caulobacter flavus]AYV45554.1 hypothetical protein C1707_04415 [Caulobacter flavus]PLR10594.1 hypothetical protein CFHF_16715 [Caulobacter flavus]